MAQTTDIYTLPSFLSSSPHKHQAIEIIQRNTNAELCIVSHQMQRSKALFSPHNVKEISSYSSPYNPNFSLNMYFKKHIIPSRDSIPSNQSKSVRISKENSNGLFLTKAENKDILAIRPFILTLSWH